MSESMKDLEKDIEASRERLDRTIDRIQDRLTPGSLVDEMLGSARRTPLNGLYDNALAAVRANPVPVLLIAAGIGLLLNRTAPGRRITAARPPSVDTPVMSTGADRVYDPDQPMGRPIREAAPETQV